MQESEKPMNFHSVFEKIPSCCCVVINAQLLPFVNGWNDRMPLDDATAAETSTMKVGLSRRRTGRQWLYEVESSLCAKVTNKVPRRS